MFKICNLKLIIYNYCYRHFTWELFKTKEASSADLHISVHTHLTRQYGIDILPPQPGSAVLKSSNALLSANEDWSEAGITLLDGKDEGVEGALIAAIMTHLSVRGGLMAHASLIDVQGNGILFLGPSGIGKTTQAKLWRKYRDAVIINGDMALVRLDGEEYTGYGCPWHGSSSYCENRQVPLRGIVVLEQAMENTIIKLCGMSIVERVIPNIFLPNWYARGVEGVLETMDGLLSCVPVYLLRCRPEEEAVALVQKVLSEEGCSFA